MCEPLEIAIQNIGSDYYNTLTIIYIAILNVERTIVNYNFQGVFEGEGGLLSKHFIVNKVKFGNFLSITRLGYATIDREQGKKSIWKKNLDIGYLATRNIARTKIRLSSIL